MIIKSGNKYLLISKTTGKTLGTHKTKASAQAQEVAIRANKKRR